MQMITLIEMQKDLSAIDMGRIQHVYDEFSKDVKQLLEFVTNPDLYMESRLPKLTTEGGLHFHVSVEGVLYPGDDTELIDKIVVSKVIKVASAHKDAVLEAMRGVPRPDPRPPTHPCRGCRRCMIAIIGWD